MKNINFLSAVCLVIALTFAGCQKEPVVGPEGKQGPPGTNGTNGTNGKDGNANVLSGTFNVTTWTYSEPVYYVDIAITGITQTVLNTGAVLVWVKIADNAWSQLPLTIYTNPAYSSTLEVITAPGLLHIEWTDSDLAQPNPPPALTFKVVVIASSGTLMNTNVNWSDYLAVSANYGLKD